MRARFNLDFLRNTATSFLVVHKLSVRKLAHLLAMLPLALYTQMAPAAGPGVICSDAYSTVEVQVAFTPGTPIVDESKAARDLERTNGRASASLQLGVTRATTQRAVRVLLEERSRCWRPKVLIQVSVQPIVVELASELRADACLRAYILDHEMQHVALYNAAADRAATQLEREMRGRLSLSRLLPDTDKLRELQIQVTTRWLPYLDAMITQGDPDQFALDVHLQNVGYGACNGVLAQFVRAVR